MLAACKSKNENATTNETPSSKSGVTVYEDLAGHPESVRVIVEEIANIPAGSSRDEYQNILKQIGKVEVPYQHFKDYEYYWKIRSSDWDWPAYMVTGAFARFSDGLAYSSISIIEQPGSKRKTIWSIQHDPDSHLTVPTSGVETMK